MKLRPVFGSRQVPQRGVAMYSSQCMPLAVASSSRATYAQLVNSKLLSIVLLPVLRLVGVSEFLCRTHRDSKRYRKRSDT